MTVAVTIQALPGLLAVAAANLGNPAGAIEGMALAKFDPAPDIIHPSARASVLFAAPGSTNSFGPLSVTAYRYEFKGLFRGQTNATLPLVEFRAESTGAPHFTWSCWDSANNHPYDFRLFQGGNGEIYACYGSGHGVELFRIASGVTTEEARRLRLEEHTGPGALTPLSNAVLEETAGAEPFQGLNALHWSINVDSVTTFSGELRVALHGENLRPRFTFALRQGRWVLISKE